MTRIHLVAAAVGSNLTCLDVANSEHDACLGGCVTDWT